MDFVGNECGDLKLRKYEPASLWRDDDGSMDEKTPVAAGTGSGGMG